MGHRASLLWALLLSGCAEAAAPNGPDGPSTSDALFDPMRVFDVTIEMPEADWDAVRTQTRNVDHFLGAGCQPGPFPSPFVSRSATVTIDGERLEDVGVRKKGAFGSLDSMKPSLKIDFDEYEPKRTAFGVKSLTLNNNKQDQSALRQCLSYRLYAAAGIPSPRCAFARVRVNGRELGVYSHVEAVNNAFLRRNFQRDDSRIYEGTQSDFRRGWVHTFEPKTDDDNPDRSDLEAVMVALEAPDTDLEAALAAVVDVDGFINFWAMETLIENHDGYAHNANNYFVYKTPGTNLFAFAPWGADLVMHPPSGGIPPSAVLASSMLTRRLYLLPATRNRYLDRLRSLLRDLWDEASITADIDRMASMLEGPLAFDPLVSLEDVVAAQRSLRDFVSTREQRLGPTLAGPAWTSPLLAPFCLVSLGPIAGTFTTTFRTQPPPDVFAAGSGTLSGNVGDAIISGSRVGSAAMRNPDGRVGTQVVSNVSPTLSWTAAVNVVRKAIADDITLPLDSFFSFLYRHNPTTLQTETIGYLIGGTVTFLTANPVEGAEVSGHFESQVYTVIQ